MQRLGTSYPIFLDATGALAFGNQIYIGVANEDPQGNPITVYWDSALTQVASQPLTTVAGRIVNGAIPANVFFAESDYSIRQLDPFGVLVDYQPSAYVTGNQYQPYDSDLTAIAALTTTPFGRSLLTVANATGLLNALGQIPYLSTSGGQLSGNLTVNGNVYAEGGTYQIGTSGQTYTGIDQNGYINLNGDTGCFLRYDKTDKIWEFYIAGDKVGHIGATGGFVSP